MLPMRHLTGFLRGGNGFGAIAKAFLRTSCEEPRECAVCYGIPRCQTKGLSKIVQRKFWLAHDFVGFRTLLEVNPTVVVEIRRRFEFYRCRCIGEGVCAIPLPCVGVGSRRICPEIVRQQPNGLGVIGDSAPVIMLPDKMRATVTIDR